MNQESKPKKLGPQIAKPTKEEVNEAIIDVMKKYEVVITQDEAVQYVKLRKELGWWITVEKEANMPDKITYDMVKETGGSAVTEETRVHATEAVIATATQRKEQIAQEIRDLIAKRRDR